jgi:hypothetical protein
VHSYKLYGLSEEGQVLFGREVLAADFDEARAQADAALELADEVELWRESVRVYRRRKGA